MVMLLLLLLLLFDVNNCVWDKIDFGEQFAGTENPE